MDKKRNKIFVGCLALLLVMVAGYALFSQNLTINGTAKAQGEFSLSMTCTPGILDEIKNYEAGYASQSGYSNDSCSVANDTVTFHADLAYPTARRYFTVKVFNTGSVTAVDEKVDVAGQEYNAEENKDCKYNSSDDSLDRCFRPDLNIDEIKYIKKTKNGEISYLTEGDKLTLEPGDTFYLALVIAWPRFFSRPSFKTGKSYVKSIRHYTLDFVQETK